MSVTTQPYSGIGQPPPFPVRRFTVDEYHRMIQADVLTEDDPVELLEGWIVPKMPRNPPHDATIELVDETVRAQLPVGWGIRVQSAVTTDDSEPEPDLTIVRGSVRSHVSHHPSPQDIGVIIEVADSSLAHDRDVKGRLYARASIPVYWIINLVDSTVEVYTDPSGPSPTPTYRQRRDYTVHESVLLVIEGREVAQITVRDLLP